MRSAVVVRSLDFEEQLSKFPAHLLDVVCADAHLVQLTECFSEWQTHLATSLQLTPVEVEDIERAWPRDPAMQRVKMFRRWKSKLSSQATYRSVPTIRPLQINFLFPVLETTNVVCGRAVNPIIYIVARPTGNTYTN